ncbi:hypothetical protein GGX14DRAFT_563403 [Mycena pura]|uniref:Uncharacterized protein n=1 Tax=Mycena pura TaxID=153505 RepID=A0AAD6VI85_9AGAR|nr:hypothetical protein GGX14DRAFT_563403 [Mycena pura]
MSGDAPALGSAHPLYGLPCRCAYLHARLPRPAPSAQHPHAPLSEVETSDQALVARAPADQALAAPTYAPEPQTRPPPRTRHACASIRPCSRTPDNSRARARCAYAPRTRRRPLPRTRRAPTHRPRATPAPTYAPYTRACARVHVPYAVTCRRLPLRTHRACARIRAVLACAPPAVPAPAPTPAPCPRPCPTTCHPTPLRTVPRIRVPYTPCSRVRLRLPRARPHATPPPRTAVPAPAYAYRTRCACTPAPAPVPCPRRRPSARAYT